MPRLNASGWKKGDLRIWSGELENIPNGWELAEEMIDRAVVGAGGAYSKGQKFGNNTQRPDKPSVSVSKPSVSVSKPSVSVSVQNHTLSTSRIPAHGHSGTAGANAGTGSQFAASTMTGRTLSTNNAGSSGAHNHGATVSVGNISATVGNITATVGNVGTVDTRQESIAVIWIKKI
ncbi:tail protein [Vibrio phage vB_VruC_PG21]|uniref:Tail protein n=1 Tax=Vibrio phage vB_VruC_PG21 TaxID=2928757 RepID=A0AAE9GSF5_9VIRU|nr:hypothetical protein [Vibrio sp. CK2-1]MCF7355080.1 hypothetical protein [Vibrio sp. CK2-1]UOL48282.1 tail protein [Vibrio phage vB_VruC_PG21]